MLRAPVAVEAAVHTQVADGRASCGTGTMAWPSMVMPCCGDGCCCDRQPICASAHELALAVVEAQRIEAHEVVHPIVEDAQVGEAVGKHVGVVGVAERCNLQLARTWLQRQNQAMLALQ